MPKQGFDIIELRLKLFFEKLRDASMELHELELAGYEIPPELDDAWSLITGIDMEEDEIIRSFKEENNLG